MRDALAAVLCFAIGPIFVACFAFTTLWPLVFWLIAFFLVIALPHRPSPKHHTLHPFEVRRDG